MTVEKEYRFGGLNLRQTDLVVDKAAATDVKNIELNYAGELVKRNGYHIDTTMPDEKEIIELIHYKESDELVAMAADGLYRKNGATFDKIVQSPQSNGETWNGKISHVEINGILFIADQERENNVFKYDGNRFYRAGSPKIVTTTGNDTVSGFSSQKRRIGQEYGQFTHSWYGDGTSGSRYSIAVVENDSIYHYEDVSSFTDDSTPTFSLRQTFDYPNCIEVGAGGKTLCFNYSRNGTTFRIAIFTRANENEPYILLQDLEANTIPGVVVQEVNSISVAYTADGSLTTFPLIALGDRNNSTVYILEYIGGITNEYVLQDTLISTDATGAAADFGRQVQWFWDESGLGQQLLVGTTSNNIHRFRFTTSWVWVQALSNPNFADPEFGRHYRAYGRTALLAYGGSFSGAPADSGAVFLFEKTTGDADLFAGTRSTVSNSYTGGANPTAGVQFGLQIGVDPASIPTNPDAMFGVTGEGVDGEVYVSEDYLTATPATSWQVIASPFVSDTSTRAQFGWTLEIFEKAVATKPTHRYLIPFAFEAQVDGIDKLGAGEIYEDNGVDAGYNIFAGGNNPRNFRYYYSILDDKLNIINSAFTQRLINGSVYDMPMPSMYAPPFEEFSPLIVVGSSDNDDDFTRADGTAVIEYTEENVQVGDALYIITVQDIYNIDTMDYEPVEVTAVDAFASTVTVDLSLLRETSIVATTIYDFNGEALTYHKTMGNTRVRLFTSLDEFFNYQVVHLGYSEKNVDGFVAPNTVINLTNDEVDIRTSEVTFMDDVYDTTVVKQEIPKIKYLTSYQNHLVGGNIDYPAEVPQTGFKNQIIWSDFSIGGSLESFAPFDFSEIGVSNDTEITSVFGAQDAILVFKTSRVFYINGTLIAGQFRVRETLSEGIGAVSHNSITEVSDGAVFMSDRGIYHAMGGNKPTELSDINEPLFESDNVTLSDSVSILDPIKEDMLMFLKGSGETPNRILAYDYYFQQWFIIEDVPMSGPMAFFNKEVHLADGSEVRKPSDDYQDEFTVDDPGVPPLPQIWDQVCPNNDNDNLHQTWFRYSFVSGTGESITFHFYYWSLGLGDPGPPNVPPPGDEPTIAWVDIELIDFDSDNEVANKTAAEISTVTGLDADSEFFSSTVTVTSDNDGEVDPDHTDAGTGADSIIETQLGRDQGTTSEFRNVSASYATGWHDIGEAGVRKKFVNLVMFSLNRVRDFAGIANPPNYTLNVKTQVDWVNTDKESFTMDFTDEVRDDDHKFAITQNKSMRLIFENSENVNMLISGYQIEWQGTQGKPKGNR